MSQNKQLDIHRSDRGEYYEMYVDGKFEGNYSTVSEAAQDYEKLMAEEESNND